MGYYGIFGEAPYSQLSSDTRLCFGPKFKEDAIIQKVPVSDSEKSIITIAVTLVYLVRSKFTKGPRGSINGRRWLSACGAIVMGLNVWQFVELVQSGDSISVRKTIPLFSAPLSPICKPALSLKSPLAKPILFVVDLVSDLTTAGCRIAAGFDFKNN